MVSVTLPGDSAAGRLVNGETDARKGGEYATLFDFPVLLLADLHTVWPLAFTVWASKVSTTWPLTFTFKQHTPADGDAVNVK
jgi:hypothetical protein